jgi:hypothetical protein
MVYRRYLITVTIALCVAFLATAVFNVAINPYLVYPVPRIPGVSSLKVAAVGRERLMKAFDSPRHDAKSILLGSSRSDFGLSPKSPRWSDENRPVYNLSIAGSSIKEDYEFLLNYINVRKGTVAISSVYIGLDFEYFLASSNNNSFENKGDALLSYSAHLRTSDDFSFSNSLLFAKELLWSTFSLDATIDSLRTIYGSVSGGGSDLQPDGLFLHSGLNKGLLDHGPRAVFDATHLDYVKNYGNTRRVLDRRLNPHSSAWSALSSLIHLAGNHNIELVIYLQPNHVERWDLLFHLGHLQDFELWKADVLAAVQEGVAQRISVSLIDAAGFDRAHRQDVPDKNNYELSSLNYFDSIHYRGDVANLIIDSLVSKKVDPSLGASIKNIEELNKRNSHTREQLNLWRSLNSATSQRLFAMACKSKDC